MDFDITKTFKFFPQLLSNSLFSKKLKLIDQKLFIYGVSILDWVGKKEEWSPTDLYKFYSRVLSRESRHPEGTDYMTTRRRDRTRRS